MSTSPKALRAKPVALAVGLVTGVNEFTVCLEDGRRVSVPYALFPRLDRATPDQRRHFVVCGRGRMLHWPEIDEDIAVQHLVEGRLPSKEPVRRLVVAEAKSRYGKK